MADLQGRNVFKVFNQDFIDDERYNVTKELGQGAYGIVWYVSYFFAHPSLFFHTSASSSDNLGGTGLVCAREYPGLLANAWLAVRLPTSIRAKVLQSKRSPMFSARRS